MKLLTLVLTTAFVLFFFNNCSNEKSNETIIIPQVQTRCLSLAANNCTQTYDNKLVFMGLIESTSETCGQLLTSNNMNFLHNSFDASSIAQANFENSPHSLVVLLSQWKGAEGISISTIRNKNHMVCAFIDSNDDGLLNTNEPILEQTVPAQDLKVLTLEGWNNH